MADTIPETPAFPGRAGKEVDVVLPDAPAVLAGPKPANSTTANPPSRKRKAETNDNRPEEPKSTQPLEEVTIDGIRYCVQPEGLAKILLPADAKSMEVFYNYIQQFNRDLTMVVTRGFAELFDRERKDRNKQHRGGVKHRKKSERELAGRSGEGDAGTIPQVDGNGDSKMADIESEGGAALEEVGINGADDEDGGIIAENGLSIDLSTAKEAENAVSNEPKPRFAILDALSATGLRALRYAKEIPSVTTITANDMSYSAVQSINRNVVFNEVSHLVTPSVDNAIGLMYRTAYPAFESDPRDPTSFKPGIPQKFHVIDLDPYGTAAPFFDAALQALQHGGLLSVTCTDAAIFASTSYPEKTFALYGGMPTKGDFSHEAGLRMILLAITTTAARYGLAIEPLLSLSIDYYCRLFVRVRRSPEKVKQVASKSMLLYNCGEGCGSYTIQEIGTMKLRDKNSKYGIAQGPSTEPSCEFCGFKMHIGGPMYSDPIHSDTFINHLLSHVISDETVAKYATLPRVIGSLQTALAELMPPPPPPPSPPISTIDSIEHSQTEEPLPQIENAKNGDAKVDKRMHRSRKREMAKAAIVTGPHKRNPNADPLALFFMPTRVSRTLHCEAPSMAGMRGALMGLGYHVTRSHCRPGSIKTDAPWSTIWRIMRAWTRVRPVKQGSLKPEMPGWKILYGHEREDESHEEWHKIVFDEKLGKVEGKEKGIINYQFNPTKNWGPMVKAGKGKKSAAELNREGNQAKDQRRRNDGENDTFEGDQHDKGEEKGNTKKRKTKRRRPKQNIESQNLPAVPPSTAVAERTVTNKNETPAKSIAETDYSIGQLSDSEIERLDSLAVAAAAAANDPKVA